MIWTLAAGNCQFAGCNQHLLGDLVSGRRALNKAYVAHIVADEPNGPRGHEVRSRQLADDPENLMLLCDPHHRLVDVDAPDEYPESRLLAMKAAHESRIAIVRAIGQDSASHVLLYAARVGEHDCPVHFDLAQAALMPARWPAEPRGIQLEMANVALGDHEPDYWPMQVQNLQRKFETRVRERITSGEIRHLSVFALAPQPLLIELGRLLGDIGGVTVHQLHREPQGWDWRAARPPLAYEIGRPAGSGGKVALKLGLSAQITDTRVQAVLGEDAAIWSITTPEPHNDIMHRAEDLAGFRRALRSVYEEIKQQHGEDVVIHLFPALPVACAVEAGRVWMPKAHPPLLTHDQCRRVGGFVHRHTVAAAPIDGIISRLETAHG